MVGNPDAKLRPVQCRAARAMLHWSQDQLAQHVSVARATIRQALDLLPEPRDIWEAYTWLNASIGEACYFQENYGGAVQVLFDALNGPEAQANPFIHYMLGKSLWKRGGDEERAIDELLRAYMLDGNEIFEGDEEEGPAMLRLLIERDLIEDD